MLGLSKRALTILALVLAIFVASRLIVRALPGDPVDTLLAETGTTLAADAIRADLHLDRPLLPSLAADFTRALRGDFGTSLITRQPVAPLLARRFGRTLELTFCALALGVLASVLLGLGAAASPGSGLDRACTIHGALSAALPTPWIGPVLILVFAVWIPLVPVGGSVILPALTMALHFSGIWARLIRARVRETLATGSAPGARARGVPEWKVLLKYGLMPAAGALIAFLGTQIGTLLGGAVITEIVFDWRGLGSLLVDSVLKRDYPTVEAATFIVAALSLLGAWFGDLMQARIDPRLTQIR